MPVSLESSTLWAQDGGEVGAIAGTAMSLLRSLVRWLSDENFNWGRKAVDETIRIATFWGLLGGLGGFVLYFVLHVHYA